MEKHSKVIWINDLEKVATDLIDGIHHSKNCNLCRLAKRSMKLSLTDKGRCANCIGEELNRKRLLRRHKGFTHYSCIFLNELDYRNLYLARDSVKVAEYIRKELIPMIEKNLHGNCRFFR